MDGRTQKWLFGALVVVTLLRNGFSKDLGNSQRSIPRSQLSHGFEELLLRLIFPEHDALNDMLCFECKAALKTLKTAYSSGLSVKEVNQMAINVCDDLHLFPHDVCEGMVTLEGIYRKRRSELLGTVLGANEDTALVNYFDDCPPRPVQMQCKNALKLPRSFQESVLYILNATNYGMEPICGFLLGQDHCRKHLKSWTMEVPENKPQLDDPEPSLPAAKTIRILHITDSHMDLQYDEGSAVDCDYPLCCRHRFGDPKPGETAAGHWGAENGCDIPLHTLEELVHQAAALKPDLVYMTGDFPAHNVWEQTKESNVESVDATLSLLKKYMPNTPVLNCMGNHESAPVNSFAVPAAYDAGYNMDFLYESCVDMWSEWLPEDTFDDIRRGGYYSYSPYPGFRVVSLNMNYCDVENFWLLLDSVDPTGQLQWLIETLSAAEAAREKVHILAHFAPGKFCEDSWNKVFNRIITRYESTIRAMFHGHTHTEAFSLVYDPVDPLRPVAVGFTGPEGSTFEFHQPAFKMYTVDANHDKATWSVIDMQTYTMNMSLANQPGSSPMFLQRYTSQEAYGVDTLTPSSVDNLMLNMATDKELFAQYIRNKHNHFLEPPEMVMCPEDPDCRKEELCDVVNTDHHIRDACDRIKKTVDDVDFYFE